VFNDRGRFQGPAHVDDALMPGLVMANVGHWASSSAGGSSVNAITSDEHSTLGNAGVYSDNLVEVIKLDL
jgi:anaerobic selenocysteine-containing dehydrogenase